MRTAAHQGSVQMMTGAQSLQGGLGGHGIRAPPRQTDSGVHGSFQGMAGTASHTTPFVSRRPQPRSARLSGIGSASVYENANIGPSAVRPGLRRSRLHDPLVESISPEFGPR